MLPGAERDGRPGLCRAALSDEHEAELVVGRTATVGVRRRHHPLAAASGNTDGRPACLEVEHAVPGAPGTAAGGRTAAHHERLTFDAQSSTGHQRPRPLAQRSPHARTTTLRQPELSAVPATISNT